ncbi:hypothetical protein EYF80_067030 [Liparis tanakae]|uniref:Uncharacterized protein n=1 Tax=Liparis tanakae TaxID=230148 RepID=A0A4Z2E2H9_9TELE|nr:hypothetical protein EYF80_067030 [Liparis tanakae]
MGRRQGQWEGGWANEKEAGPMGRRQEAPGLFLFLFLFLFPSDEATLTSVFITLNNKETKRPAGAVTGKITAPRNPPSGSTREPHAQM